MVNGRWQMVERRSRSNVLQVGRFTISHLPFTISTLQLTIQKLKETPRSILRGAPTLVD
jgi:hypothetical protein